MGELLKKRREDREWKQGYIAKTIDCAIGTVQAIEYNKYKVDRDTIDKYAAMFGATVPELLHPDPAIPPAGVLVTDLNREHLAIARGYMRAVKAVRTAVEHLVLDTQGAAEITEEIADVVNALKTASANKPQIAYWTLFILQRGLMQDIAEAIHGDPMFEEQLENLLNEPTTSPTPRAPKGKTK